MPDRPTGACGSARSAHGDHRAGSSPCGPGGSHERWCGRRDSNPYSRGKQIFVPLRLSPPPLGRSWSGLSLRRGLPALGAARPVSTPSPVAGSLARDRPGAVGSLAFPEFERFYAADFPAGTPIEVCCVYRFRHVRALAVLPHRKATRGGRDMATNLPRPQYVESGRPLRRATCYGTCCLAPWWRRCNGWRTWRGALAPAMGTGSIARPHLTGARGGRCGGRHFVQPFIGTVRRLSGARKGDCLACAAFAAR